MSSQSWLQTFRTALTSSWSQRHSGRRSLRRAGPQRPHLEVLEDRLTLSFGGGGPSPPDNLDAPIAWAPPPPLVADFTSDGILDEISSNSHEVVVRPGHSDGTFGDPIRTSIHATPGAPLLAVADFNGDNRLDVFTAAAIDFESPPTVNVLLGLGDGRFVLAETFSVGTVPTMIGTGQIYGTGRTDVAIAGYDYLSGEQGVLALFNDGQWWEPSPPPPPIDPNLSIDDVTVNEGNTGTSAATFSVSLSAASAQPVTVSYATSNGAATAGSDYQAATGTLTFAPGETSKTITVAVKGDRLAEPNETFAVNLMGATNATIADGQAIGTIIDDEPRISISDVTKKEGKKNQTTLFTFTVTLSGAYDQAVTMSFRTADGTAKTSNSDYVAKSGTLTFKPGETTKTITIEVKGDSKKEANETFYLDLFGLSINALFTKNRGLGTILNDD